MTTDRIHPGETFALGIDLGSTTAKVVICDIHSGEIAGTGAADYISGRDCIFGAEDDPDIARQDPLGYLNAVHIAVRQAITVAISAGGQRAADSFNPAKINGIGICATGSTVIPVDDLLMPLSANPEFSGQLAALAWMWKDHSAHAEAAEIEAAVAARNLPWLGASAGHYSSEWFWAKLLACARTAPHVFAAASSWIELQDFVPATLAGISDPTQVKRGICAAGHKGMYLEGEGGWPDADFLNVLEPGLGAIVGTLGNRTYSSGGAIGTLSSDWASKLGLAEGIPISVGLLDAHAGAVGSGVRYGRLVKIVGTSSCDITVSSATQTWDSNGLAGVVDGSVLPGSIGIEAGQAAVGDLLAWGARIIASEDPEQSHELLSEAASRLVPGASGLIALDWNNGNRSPLMDSRLTGLLIGQTLETSPTEIYRALMESIAFGARLIRDRIISSGAEIDDLVICGGVAVRSPLMRQVLADVLGCPVHRATTEETSALGAAIFGAVVGGRHENVESAQDAMASALDTSVTPDLDAHAIYSELFAIYLNLHAAFGGIGPSLLGDTMKRLLDIRDRTRAVNPARKSSEGDANV